MEVEMTVNWRGVLPALMTEFKADGSLDLEATASLPNPTEIYRMLGLDYSFERPLEIRASASSDSGHTDFTLTASGTAADLLAHGTVDRLLSPNDLDLQVEFEGPVSPENTNVESLIVTKIDWQSTG